MAALRHSVETGAVVKVQGTVTAVDQAGPDSPSPGPGRQPEHRVQVLGPGWKSRTKAQVEARESRVEGEGLDQAADFEAHQPAAGVADAAGHDLTDQPARLDRGP